MPAEDPGNVLARIVRTDEREDITAAINMARRKAKPFRDVDVTWEQVELAHARGMTGGQMARDFGVNAASVSRAIAALELKPNGTFDKRRVQETTYRRANREGLTLYEAAAKLKVTPRAVSIAWSGLELPSHKTLTDNESRTFIERCLDNGESVHDIAGKTGLRENGIRKRVMAIYERRLKGLNLRVIPGPNYDIRKCAAILACVPHLIKKEGLESMEGKIRYYMMNFGLSVNMMERNPDLLEYPLSRIRPRLEYFSNLKEEYMDRTIEASGVFSETFSLFKNVHARKIRQMLACTDEGFIEALKRTNYTRSAGMEEYRAFKRRLSWQLSNEGRTSHVARQSSDMRS